MPQSKQFDLNLFRVFISVYQTGSFTRSAGELELTQSSVSNAIARLKKNLGETLFTRAGRSIKPTAFATQLYVQIEPALVTLELAHNSAQQFDPRTDHREFNIYAPESIVDKIQHTLALELQDYSVRVVCQEYPINEKDAWQDLYSLKFDLAVDIKRPHSASFSSEKLGQARLCCIAAKGHPRIQASLSRQQFFAEEHVVTKLQRYNTNVIDLLAEDSLPPRKVYSVHSSLMPILATVGKSEAISVMPNFYAKKYAEVFQLQTLRLPIPMKPTETYMIWLSRNRDDSALTWLREIVRRHVQARDVS